MDYYERQKRSGDGSRNSVNREGGTAGGVWSIDLKPANLTLHPHPAVCVAGDVVDSRIEGMANLSYTSHWLCTDGKSAVCSTIHPSSPK